MTGRARSVLSLDAREALGEVGIPLLSIRAKRDRLVDPRSAPEAHVELPTATVDAPHLALHARPAECAVVIGEWLEMLAP